MKRALALALCATTLIPAAAQAEITNAEVGFDYSTFADGRANDMHKATLGGALEFAISPQFSVQANLAQRYYGLADWDGTTFALHGIWHISDAAAIGGFVGKDWLDDGNNNAEFYGLEYKGNTGLITYEAYGTYADGEHDDGYGLGLRGAYAMNDRLSLGARFETMNADANLTRLGATAQYEFLPGLQANGELGLADPEDSDKEVFLSLGLKATFGAGQGVTFSGRGVQEILPGY